MEVAVDHTTQLKEELRKITQPLVDHLANVNAEIDQAETRIAELREVRKQLRTIVRGIDPALVPALYKTNGKKKQKERSDTGTRVGKEKVEAVTDWLQEHRDELNANGGFRNVDLRNRDDFELDISPSVLSKALAILHEQGILNLDRWIRGADYPHRPTGKFYKVA